MNPDKPYLNIILDTCIEHSKSYVHNQIDDLYGVYQNVITASEYQTLKLNERHMVKPILFNYLNFQNPNNQHVLSFADLFENLIYGLNQFKNKNHNPPLCLKNHNDLTIFANQIQGFIHHPAIDTSGIQQIMAFMIVNFTTSLNYVYNQIRIELSHQLTKLNQITFDDTDWLYEKLKQLQPDTINPNQTLNEAKCYGYRLELSYTDLFENELEIASLKDQKLSFQILTIDDLINILQNEIHTNNHVKGSF